jgi:t-SNARE complex subunit (syntaxin)
MNQLSYFNSSFHSNHSLYNLNIDTILKNKYATANIGLKFYMESQKAINLKWQREISAGVIFYSNNIYNKQINNLTVYNAIDNKDYAATNLYFSYEKSYIPNTRTNITGYVSLNSTIQKNTKSNFKYHQNTGLGLTVNYWIAPRLQTKLNAEIFHFLSFDKYKNIQSSMTTNLNCGLLYYFY